MAGDDRPREHAEHEHPARPEQQRTGYGEGLEHDPRTPDEELEPDFARGARTGPESEVEHRGSFSEGIEQTPDAPDEHVERDFGEGIERERGGD